MTERAAGAEPALAVRRWRARLAGVARRRASCGLRRAVTVLVAVAVVAVAAGTAGASHDETHLPQDPDPGFETSTIKWEHSMTKSLSWTWSEFIARFPLNVAPCEKAIVLASQPTTGEWVVVREWVETNGGTTRHREELKRRVIGDCTIEILRELHDASGSFQVGHATITVYQRTPNDDEVKDYTEHTVFFPADPGASYEDLVAGLAAEAGACAAEIARGAARDTGSWTDWRHYTENFVRSRESLKSVRDGHCDLVFTYTEIQAATVYEPAELAVRVRIIPDAPPPWRLGDSRIWYCETNGFCPSIERTLAAPTLCRTEARSILDSSNLHPNFGSRVGKDRVYLHETDSWRRLHCIITRTVYSVWSTQHSGIWRGQFVRVTHIKSPHTYRPPPGPQQGDKRYDCKPAFKQRYPHLCLEREPDNPPPPVNTPTEDGKFEQCTGRFALDNPDKCNTQAGSDKQTQCTPTAALMAPEGCKDAHIEGPPVDPGYDPNPPPINPDEGIQLDPGHKESPAQKGDRLIHNMKHHDQACKTDPTLTCGVYPFTEWGF